MPYPKRLSKAEMAKEQDKKKKSTKKKPAAKVKKK